MNDGLIIHASEVLVNEETVVIAQRKKGRPKTKPEIPAKLKVVVPTIPKHSCEKCNLTVAYGDKTKKECGELYLHKECWDDVITHRTNGLKPLYNKLVDRYNELNDMPDKTEAQNFYLDKLKIDLKI